MIEVINRAVQVLIETYWNVNKLDLEVNKAGSFSINRNILECKCQSRFFCASAELVLIETYWNVNGIGKEYYDAHAKY